MRIVKPVVAVLSMSLLAVSLSALSGCGGGSSGGGSKKTIIPITKPTVSPTFTTSNTAPGVQSGATATSGTGNSGTTTSGSNPSSTTFVPVTQIDLQPATATLEANRQLTYTALGKDISGNSVTVPDGNWKWTSSNPAVAVLTSTGNHATISGVVPGTATITVLEGKSGVAAQATLTVIALGTGTGSTPVAGSGSTPVGGGIGGGASGGTSTGGGTISGPSAGSTLFYANDFTNGAGNEWSSTLVSTTPGTPAYPATPFLGEFANGSVSLNLASLPVHTSLTVELDLFIIQTWDGNNPASGIGPDTFTINTDSGQTLLYTTFANITPQEALGYPGSVYQSFPDTFVPSNPVNHLYQTGASRLSQLGYQHNTSFGNLPSDSVYHLKYTFAHSASSLKVNFTSGQTQPISDEGWGLKNVQVTTNP